MHRVHDCMLRLPEIHLKEQFMAQLANVTQHTTHTHTHMHTHTHTHLTALFRDYPGKPVPER